MQPTRGDILGNGGEMNDPGPALKHLGAALDAGDREAVMACFAADATVDVIAGDKRMSFSSKGIRDAIDSLLTGFDRITFTPTTRLVSEARVVEEAVLSGDHMGSFAGAAPTQSRVHVNVKLTATADGDSNLQSLRVDADARALFAQIAGNDDVAGAFGGIIAGVRERHEGVRVIDAPRPPEAPAKTASEAGAAPTTKRSRRRWAVLPVAAILLLIAFVAWRAGSADPSIAAGATHPATATSTPTSTPSQPATTPAPTTAAALPVIATAAPTAVPHVQAGRQVVLASDVLFALNSSALTPAAQTAVTTLAGQIRAAGVTGTIQVNGYTDNLGSIAYDLALSRARALAVAQVLQAGLAGQPVTLTPQGFGQANPVAPNTTDANRARNRRVTIVLPKLP
jgi:outer membrane protein OmpA-like peptidoglycan-associated protein